MPVATTPQVTSQIEAALVEWSAVDGWFYPSFPARSLVRIQIKGGHYTIQRRHTVQTPWTLLVRAMVADFDPAAFATWRDGWAMIAPLDS